MIHDERIQILRPGTPGGGKYVLYWMQTSVRAEDNHALEYAIDRANDLKQPLLVYFGLTTNYPEANARSFFFLLEGLRDAQAGLRGRGLDLLVREVAAPEGALDLSREASLVVTDRGYLHHLRDWRRDLATQASVPVHQIEPDVIVPVNTASNKREVGARTLRPKLQRLMDKFLVPVEPRQIQVKSQELFGDGLDVRDPAALIATLDIDKSVPHGEEPGGSVQARARLQEFLDRDLPHYEQMRNDPNAHAASRLSAFIHYGHVSALRCALDARERPHHASFIEELMVRRELAINFTEYEPDYWRYDGLPNWARKTLEEHAGDPREYLYTREQLEAAGTHDPYWNAAMTEMRRTGRMANYMRMYWGKKVLEWSETPRAAFETLLAINNRYFLDGRNPNSYANVAWVFGNHDRPWAPRPIFGNVRYMAASGLKRKFDIEAYARRWA